MDGILTLAELAEQSGVEPRTIRSYIERGLLPNADSRGRGAGYTQEHLTRLQLIKSIKNARPNVQLSEIRSLFQQSSPDQIRNLAGGTVTAAASAVTQAVEGSDITESPSEVADDPAAEATPHADISLPSAQLTAAQRLAHSLRHLTGHMPSVSGSKVEKWHRIPVTADVELTVRGYGEDQLLTFCEVASLLRHLLMRTDLPMQQGED